MRASRTEGSIRRVPGVERLDPKLKSFWHPKNYLPYTLIRPKVGGLVPFTLYPFQETLVEAVYQCFLQRKWFCHLKSRREGSTTTLVGILMQHCMFRPGVMGGILSHKKGNALEDLVRMCHRNWKSFPEAQRPHRPAGHTKTIEFPEIESGVIVDSAHSPDPFRGQTLNLLLADEISSYPESTASDVWAAALSAVASPEEGGMVFAASTPKHFGDAMHGLVESTRLPDSPWHYLFLPWTVNHTYARTPQPGWHPSSEVQDYANKYRITPEQAYWVAVEGLPKCGNRWDKFLAEYPPNDTICFAKAGNAPFNEDRLLEMYRLLPQAVSSGMQVEAELEIYADPEPGHVYVLAVDPASSFTQTDYWGLVVMDVTTGEQVVDFQGHRHAALMAALTDQLSKRYNQARIYVEANGVGDAVLSHLTPPVRDCGRRLYRRFSLEGKKLPGWTSSMRSKMTAESDLEVLIRDGSWTFRSRRILRQLMSYRGGWSRDEQDGHFDLVGAAAIAAWAVQRDRPSLGLLGGVVEKAPGLNLGEDMDTTSLVARVNGRLLHRMALEEEVPLHPSPFGNHR